MKINKFYLIVLSVFTFSQGFSQITVTHEYPAGISLMGIPVIPIETSMETAFSESFGDYGIDWSVWKHHGEFLPIDLEENTGYLLWLNESRLLTVEGYVQDNLILNIEEGWNFISISLLENIEKEAIIILTNETDYTWHEAANYGFVQSIINFYNNEAENYTSVDILEPFNGYYVHTSRELSFRFHTGFRGDLNEDEIIDILDIVLLVNTILDVYESSAYQRWAGDLNSEYVLDILDIVLIVNLILGG